MCSSEPLPWTPISVTSRLNPASKGTDSGSTRKKTRSASAADRTLTLREQPHKPQAIDYPHMNPREVDRDAGFTRDPT